MAGLKLVSDFHDYYDFCFNPNGNREFRRMTTEGPLRREAFRLLEGVGIHTPRHGIVRDMSADVKWMVVYLDENSHRGEGKELVPASDARQRYPDLYCSEYLSLSTNKVGEEWVRTLNEPVLSYKGKNFGSSWRELVIGSRSFWLHYINCDDWRSNVGDDIRIELDTERVRFRPKRDLKYPLYAIDYVWDDTKGDFAAVDVNTAPGIGGSPVQNTFPARQVYQEITSWIRMFKPSGESSSSTPTVS